MNGNVLCHSRLSATGCVHNHLGVRSSAARLSFIHHRSSSTCKRTPGDQRGCQVACRQKQPRLRSTWVLAAAEDTHDTTHNRQQHDLPSMDANQLQTALARAISAEDYKLAKSIRDRLSEVLGAEPNIDWHSLGLMDWLVDRAERLGYKFPTEIQQRAARVVLSGADAVLQSETGSGKTMAFLLPTLSRLDYPPQLFPEDLDGPQLLVVVPTFELGVQLTLLVYRLFGGSINSGTPGDPSNMFTYAGPRGIKVKGLLRDEEVELAKKSNYLSKAHVVVTTPKHLMDLILPPQPQVMVLADCKLVVVDEVDECFQSESESTMQLLDLVSRIEDGQGRKPQTLFVGATVKTEEVALAMREGWVKDPIHVTVGGGEPSVPAGLQHRYVVCESPSSTPLSVLTHMLRRDLQEADNVKAPARVMVFANSEEQAREMGDPLRTVLWQEHRLSVLLPTGAEPVTALHAFRDNVATLLLCTPAASRGLDLPAVSHVYNMGPPPDATQYLHRAGRAGRIGATTSGIITTIVTPEQEQTLLQQAQQLRVEIKRQEPPGLSALDPSDTESTRKGLEDLFNLF